MTHSFSKRIAKELQNFYKEKHEHLFLQTVNSKTDHLRALIICNDNPTTNPYFGLFAYFDITLPSNYPHKYPEFKFLTPLNSNTRIHPNLYAAPSGKTCLSILNTWASNDKTVNWSPLLTIEKILLTISGLFIENPITCEPALETFSKSEKESIDYCICARYLTLVTVSEIIIRKTEFKDEINNYFINNYDKYMVSLCELKKYNKLKFTTIHHNNIMIDYDNLLKKFENLFKSCTEKS